MRHHFSISLLLIVLVLVAGCVVPPQAQPQSRAVVQGSTAAPTESPISEMPATEMPATGISATETPGIISIADTPAAAETVIPVPPAETLLPPVTATVTATVTPAPPANPTSAPTSAPTTAPTATSAPAPTTQPTPAPTKTPYPSGIFIASHRGFSNGSNYFVAGEVLNTAGVPVFGAKVIANFYDSGGALVAAGQTLTSLPMTEPEVGNPFKLKVENLASAVSRYELTVSWEDISLVEFRYLTVLDGEVRQGEVVGQMRNDQESDLTSIVVAVTFYDAAGAVVDTADIFLGGQTLAPGASLPFSIPLNIPLNGDMPVYDHFWIEAQGNLNLF